MSHRTVPADGPRRISRRALFGAAGAGVAGLGVAGLAQASASRPAGAGSGAELTYDFDGPHQAGIVTPVQDHLHFAAFDVLTTDRDELAGLLRAWTDAARAMTRGEDVGRHGATSGPYDAPPEDTGEAVGLPPAGLTVTFGLGPSLFLTEDGVDRFGLAARRPAALSRLPHFPGDNLDPARSDGDLCVQACANDPQVAVHAVRNLARIGFGTVALRWSQLGFGRTSSTSATQQTPRNLFGFKDGTANLTAEEPDELDRHVWVGRSGEDGAEDQWLVGGSYLVARRISMAIEPWDRTSLREQEALVGRTKGEGAPLSGGTEFSEVDFDATGRGGRPLVPVDAHVRVVHPVTNGGVRMLRRGFNFTDGSTSLGRLDAGLFFLAYVTDPRTHFIPVQTRMSREDGLMEYLQHTGSGLWAVPPGTGGDGFVAQALFA